MDESEQTLAGLDRAAAGDAAVALAAGVAAVAGSYAAAGFTPAFVGAPVEGALARAMPGVVVTLAITLLGSLGQQLNLLTALALTAAGLGVPALAARRAARSRPPVVAAAGVAVAALAVAGLVWLLTRAPASAGGAALAGAAVLALAGAAERSGTGVLPTDTERRGVLAALAGTAVAGVAAGRRGLSGRSRGRQPLPPGEARDLLREARAKSLDVEGLEPLVSDHFYQVDINSVDPTVDPEEWTLSITGAVDEAVTIDLEDLRAMESREEFVTLRCVGESLNGRKTDTALWTVVDVAPLLERAGAPDDCCVMLRAADGYFVQFPRTALETGMLAYGMNGRDLPRGHGAPVRALIPGHWGEVNTKWLSEIEVIDEPVDGYWEQRGWHGTGPVNTMAKLHVTNLLSDGRVEVAGHTYAGTRGIERVEVSTDGGETWTDAELSEPLPGEDVWRQWVHRYEPPDEAHEVVVRAVDGEGTLQTREESGAFPSGPTGWVSQTVRP
jgi:DMSO/TMAO reductase YedYZ molybdopterin-dependent catalytic subunit